MNSVLLDLLGFGAVASGILVITSNNPVISVLFLISVFLNVAGYLVLLGVAYLGLVYIIVYVGAIAILFVFTIMMLNIRLTELLDTGSQYTKNLPLATILGALFFFELLSLVDINGGFAGIPYSAYTFINGLLLGNISSSEAYVHASFAPLSPEAAFSTFSQVATIGQGLYTYSTL
jgi:NADH-ubiquinone oxidoreductase chain 6